MLFIKAGVKMQQEKYVIIAPVGDYLDDLFVGIKEFPTERVILVAPKEKVKAAEKAKAELEKFKIPCRTVEIKGNLWEETFHAVAEIKKLENEKKLLINVSTGDRETRCAATSAAFVNGIRAFGVSGSEVMMLPILKFSYYKQLTDKKMQLLKVLYGKPECSSTLDELSRTTKMSLPLLSYHINGNLKSEGLKELGLIEAIEKKGKVTVILSMMGRMLIKGYM
jgi:DNA-binding transcriptional ArsR family regulator